jgi:thiol-disulfide isomerase/thioredoxin
MKPWHLRRPLILGLLITLCFAQSATAQESANVTIPLKITRPFDQPFMMAWIEFDQEEANYTTKRKLGEVRLGQLPGGLRVAVATVADSPKTYQVRVDTDGDRDLSDETAISISESGSVNLNVTRKSAGPETVSLPYVLSYARNSESKGIREIFHWRPGYVAHGVLKVGACEAQVKALDANGDGVFDRGDFRLATTLHIDDGTPEHRININDPRVIRHADGSIEIPTELRAAGKKKWLRGEEILEVCGNSYLVDMIKPDGSALVLAKTDLRVPKIGGILPEFVLTTLDGKRIEMKRLKGTATLLDFWASWCRPCVDKFPLVKKMVESHDGSLSVIAINVDENDRLPMAREVIKEHKLAWPHVASGLGERDPLWKVFGSMANNGLVIPLYVLIDANGIIRYAGNGGENLSELTSKLKEASSSAR